MKIYNLFPLLTGSFDQWTPHYDRAEAMGFDWIFVNPIQKPGHSGSLYSIAGYLQINPLLLKKGSRQAADTQAKAAIKAANKRGLKMMVDLVINHCAIDSPLVEKKPEWFMREQDGSVSHPYCSEDGERVTWYDLARFDHQHSSDKEGLYQFFYRVVEYLIELGFSGFRCDAAYQLPVDLWRRLINEVRSKHSNIVFTAETLGCSPHETKETASAGFDYIFNSSKWWDFSDPWLLEQYQLLHDAVPSISFAESHDTERLFAETHGNLNAMKQRYLFSALFSAGVMMPIGYEFGFKRALHVVSTRPDDWEESDVDLTEFITRVNAIKSDYPIFQEDGPAEVIQHSNPNILMLWKGCRKGSQEALLILNKDAWNRQTIEVDDLYHYIQNGAPLVDLSLEYQQEYLPSPYNFELAPGMARVLMATVLK